MPSRPNSVFGIDALDVQLVAAKELPLYFVADGGTFV